VGAGFSRASRAEVGSSPKLSSQGPFVNPGLAQLKAVLLRRFLAVKDWPFDAFDLYNRTEVACAKDSSLRIPDRCKECAVTQKVQATKALSGMKQSATDGCAARAVVESAVNAFPLASDQSSILAVRPALHNHRPPIVAERKFCFRQVH
jgi:hypothetical protein